MSIDFIHKRQEPAEPVFGDVLTDQFFIDSSGRLCQRVAPNEYNIIARADGVPYADGVSGVDKSLVIREILPAVEKITWE